MNDIYIHYGHRLFIPAYFRSIKNREGFTKPNGGLWASRINAEYGWKDWCEKENFCECKEENSFKFLIDDNANILRINTVKDLENLPTIKFSLSKIWVLLDFEKLFSKGYDAVEVDISNDPDLYYALYGWDCDSILIMNPDVIVPNIERTVMTV